MPGRKAKVVLEDKLVTDFIKNMEHEESLWKMVKNNPHVQGPAWKRIALLLGQKPQVLKTKWQTLKKQMTSVLLLDVDDEERKKLFEHYKEMSFMKDILLEKAPLQPKPAVSEETHKSNDAFVASLASPPSSTSNANTSTEANVSDNTLMTATDEEYLMSLLPITGRLDDDLEKIWLRIQMLELLAFCTYDLQV